MHVVRPCSEQTKGEGRPSSPGGEAAGLHDTSDRGQGVFRWALPILEGLMFTPTNRDT